MLTEFQPLFDFALANLGDAAHGKDHILRVRRNALEIVRAYPAVDSSLIEAAAILHDCGQPEQNRDPRCDHAL